MNIKYFLGGLSINPVIMSWTPNQGIYMDAHYNLVYPKGATHLDGIDKDTMEVIDEHWGSFPPQHPLINHIVGICFFFLWCINLFGNGSVCYIFLKVRKYHERGSCTKICCSG